MPRFATIKRSRARAKSAAANDNSPNSIYAYPSEVEDLLRRLHDSENSRRLPIRLRLLRAATSIVAIALVCGVPACAGALLFLKSESVRPPTEEQFTTAKTDRLASPAPIITAAPLVEDSQPSERPHSDEDPIELIRGSIADASRAVDRPASPASRKPPQKRNADRAPPPPLRPATAPSSSPSLFETMFSWRTIFGQTSPQT
jgi:hypothetical protein